jgi:hypothetical protein
VSSFLSLLVSIRTGVGHWLARFSLLYEVGAMAATW